jgi:SAM-dependent methyltransferase
MFGQASVICDKTVPMFDLLLGQFQRTADPMLSLHLFLLKRYFPVTVGGDPYVRQTNLAALLGAKFLDEIRGKYVIDFACGDGIDAVEMAEGGAARVVGVDIRQEVLDVANRLACERGVQDRCTFGSSADPADIIVCIDAFEHFSDPAQVLRSMASLLKPGGKLIVCFGPTWYHPLGGHLFSVFPWAHLLFSEQALMKWRSTFNTDGATRFSEVSGGLNQITIARFEEIVAMSPFKGKIECVPIRKLRALHCRPTREFTTAVVRCVLTKD